MKKNVILIYLLLALTIIVVLTSCKEEGTSTIFSTVSTIDDLNLTPTSYTATAEQKITHVTPGISGNIELTYTQELGSTAKDVYFVLTNPSTTSTKIGSAISSNISNSGDISQNTSEVDRSAMNLTEYAETYGIGIKGTPGIAEFNANPPNLESWSYATRNSIGESPSFSYSVGDTNDFYGHPELGGLESDPSTVSATLRDSTSDGSVTLYIWVENDSWTSTCNKTVCLDSSILLEFKQRFLALGTNNDMYDWAKNIYGSPWGSAAASNQIPGSSSSEIHILFYDINNNGNYSVPSGGILGYFWSGDTYTSVAKSNQRLLFNMDSIFAAAPADGSWDITDYWPANSLSTLAHEFQHMIHFYQKVVVQNNSSNSDTWIDEMCAMMAEDFLSKETGLNGPRGVTYSDGSAGSSGNTTGRIADYIAYDYYSLVDWSSRMADYGLSYSFGAYLARNYGGAELFQKIVQSSYTDYRAVESAVNSVNSTSMSFSELLQQWGAAILLSDDTSFSSSGYNINSGNFFDSSVDSINYQIGSINAYNYKDGTLIGPKEFSPSEALPSSHQRASNTIIKAGSNLTGNFNATIKMVDGMKLTVVLK